MRVCIPLVTDYYLFRYFEDLVPVIESEGYSVTIFTLDDAVVARYSGICRVRRFPGMLRYLINRSGPLPNRAALWWRARRFARWASLHYDFAILPWDYRPVWNAFVGVLPTMTCHNVTDFLDVDLKMGKSYADAEFRRSRRYRVARVLGRIMRRELIPTIAGAELKWDRHWVVDKLLGYRGIARQHGFSGVDYLTVTGHQVRENFRRCGVGISTPTVIKVTGSPSYEALSSIREGFTDEVESDVRSRVEAPEGGHIYSFFLSPSSFTDEQFREVGLVVDEICEADSRAHIVLKFHPKTRSADVHRFASAFGDRGVPHHLVIGFSGDAENARLILASRAVVQKQSTVGYIAMIYRVPVISYNIVVTDYDDDMYRLIGGSWHCERVEDIGRAVRRLDDAAARSGLAGMQEGACERFCIAAESPCRRIVDVWLRHFGSATKAVATGGGHD